MFTNVHVRGYLNMPVDTNFSKILLTQAYMLFYIAQFLLGELYGAVLTC